MQGTAEIAGNSNTGHATRAKFAASLCNLGRQSTGALNSIESQPRKCVQQYAHKKMDKIVII